MPDNEEHGKLFRLKDKKGKIIPVSCTEAQLKDHWIKKLGYSLAEETKAQVEYVATSGGTDTTKG